MDKFSFFGSKSGQISEKIKMSSFYPQFFLPEIKNLAPRNVTLQTVDDDLFFCLVHSHRTTRDDFGQLKMTLDNFGQL